MTEWQARLAELVQSAPLARTFGYRLSFDDQAHAHISLPYNPSLDHAMDGVHGGVLATLLDIAGWCASAARHPGVWVATAEFSVHLVRQAARCDLRAEGWVAHGGKRQDVVEMKVVDAEDGTLYAIGSGTVVLLDLPFGMNDDRSAQTQTTA